jgi:hypothetical protein
MWALQLQGPSVASAPAGSAILLALFTVSTDAIKF